MPERKFVIYRGHKKFYSSYQELARKLKTSPLQAKKYEKDFQAKKTTKIFMDVDGHTLKVDLQKNILPLLTRSFGIKRIANDKLLADEIIIPSKDVETMKRIRKNTNVIARIIITIYITFYETNERTDEFIEIVSEKGFDQSILNDKKFLEKAKVEKRIVTGKGKFRLYEGPVNGIKAYVNEEIRKYRENIPAASVLLSTYKLYDYYSNTRLKWENQFLRADYTYILSEWDNIRYIEGNDENCVIEYLLERFPKISQKQIRALETETGVSIKNIINFCKTHKIQYNIYDETGKLRFSEKSDNKSYATLSIMAFNNHLYPLNHSKPKKAIKECKIVIVKDCLSKMKEFIDKKIIPYNINVADVITRIREQDGEINIISFRIKDDGVVKYIQNDEYKECLVILKKYQLQDKIYDSIKKNDLVSILYKKFIPENILSFIPEQQMFMKKPFQYINKENIKDKIIYTIDKNKSYTYALYTLPYLIVCDWRIAEIKKNPEKIVENYLYLVEPEKSTVLIPEENIYSGYFLKYCKKNGIKFTLKEEMTTTTVMNSFPILIDTLKEDLSEHDFKMAFNIFMGKMSRSTTINQNYECIGIRNLECRELEPGFELKIDDNHVLIFDQSLKSAHTYNMKPIDVQIKDRSRMVLFEKMKSMKLKDENIVKINTDSISFTSDKEIDIVKEYQLDSSFDGWKVKGDEEFKVSYEEPCHRYDKITFCMENLDAVQTNRQLHVCYAGTGKTHYIINTLIPRLTNLNKTYIIFTPSHKSQDEFHAAGIKNVNVIQSYDYNHKVPNVDVVIVDEIGMVNFKGHDLLYQITQTEMDLYAFGDFGQILPPKVDKPINSDHYNNYMYNEIHKMNKNHRNNFPIFYYDLLKDQKLDLVQEVNKYSTKKIEDAEYIACYRLSTRDKYNKIIATKLGIKNKRTPGARLICNSRKLMDCDIHNGQIFILKGYNKEYKTYTLEYTKDNTERVVPSKDLNKNFDIAYAINIHKYQGSQLTSYYWCKEDNRFLTGRLAYTIISRLKGDVFKDQQKYKKLIELEELDSSFPHFNLKNEFHRLKQFEDTIMRRSEKEYREQHMENIKKEAKVVIPSVDFTGINDITCHNLDSCVATHKILQNTKKVTQKKLPNPLGKKVLEIVDVNDDIHF